jgi:hypothetical protein
VIVAAKEGLDERTDRFIVVGDENGRLIHE